MPIRFAASALVTEIERRIHKQSKAQLPRDRLDRRAAKEQPARVLPSLAQLALLWAGRSCRSSGAVRPAFGRDTLWAET
jgi:hypothetical protein